MPYTCPKCNRYSEKLNGPPYQCANENCGIKKKDAEELIKAASLQTSSKTETSTATIVGKTTTTSVKKATVQEEAYVDHLVLGIPSSSPMISTSSNGNGASVGNSAQTITAKPSPKFAVTKPESTPTAKKVGYRCKKCGKLSTDQWKCSHCNQVFLATPQPEEIKDETEENVQSLKTGESSRSGPSAEEIRKAEEQRKSDELRKAEEKRLAEAEALKQQEAAKLLKQQAEQERLRKEELERQQQADLERKKAEETESKVKDLVVKFKALLGNRITENWSNTLSAALDDPANYLPKLEALLPKLEAQLKGSTQPSGEKKESSPPEASKEIPDSESKEKARLEQEELKRKAEEEERKRKEEELAKEKKAEITKLLDRLHVNEKGTFAADLDKTAFVELDGLRAKVEDKLSQVSSQADQKKQAIAELLKKLHSTEQTPFASAANAKEPFDLELLEKSRIAIESRIKEIAEQAQQKKLAITELLKKLHPSQQTPFANAANATEPFDLELLEKSRIAIESRIKEIAEQAQQKKLAITELLKKLHPSQQTPFANAANATEPFDLDLLEKNRLTIESRIKEIAEQAQQKKLAITELLKKLHPSQQTPFTNAANAKEPFDLELLEKSRIAIESRIKEIAEQAQQKKLAITELLKKLHPSQQTPFANAANATEPFDLDLLEKNRLTIESRIKEIAEQAQQKKLAITELLKKLHESQKGDFAAQAERLVKAEQIDLSKIIEIEQAVQAQIDQVASLAQKKKEAITALLNRLHADQKTNFANATNGVEPFDLNALESKRAEVEAKVDEVAKKADLEKSEINTLLSKLHPDQKGSFANAANANEPYDLNVLKIDKQKIEAKIAEVAQKAEEEKKAISELLEKLHSDQKVSFTNAANANEPFDLKALENNKSLIQAKIDEVAKKAEAEKAEIVNLFGGLPESESTAFLKEAEKLQQTVPIDLAGFTSIKQRVNEAVLKETARKREEEAKKREAEGLKPLPTEQEQVERLALPTKLKGDISTLKTKISPELASALDKSLANISSQIYEAEDQNRKNAKKKIEDAEAKAAEAEKNISTAANDVKSAEEKVSTASSKIEGGKLDVKSAAEKVASAENNVKNAKQDVVNAQKEIENAIQKHLNEQKKALWELGAEVIPLGYKKVDIDKTCKFYADQADENFPKGKGTARWAMEGVAWAFDSIERGWKNLANYLSQDGKTAGASLVSLNNANEEGKQAKTSAEELKKQAESRVSEAEKAKVAEEKVKSEAEKKLKEFEDEKRQAEKLQSEAEKKKSGFEEEKRKAEAEKLAGEQEFKDADKNVGEALAKAQATAAKMTAAIRFGPVSKTPVDPDTVVGLSTEQKAARKKLTADRDKATAAVIQSFKDFPELAASAIDAIQEADHPEAFVGGIEELGKLLKSNFGGTATNAKESAKMAKNAMRMAGLIGGDFLKRMDAYYKTDAAKQPNPHNDPDVKKATLNYTGALGDAMLGTDGGINIDGPKVEGVRNALSFHPDSLKDPMANLTRHVEKFRANMNDPTIALKCNNAVKGITTAPLGNADGLVRKTLGLGATDVLDQKHAKKAVMSAALTPLTQGPVGSCFATCNCMDYQENKPGEFMGDLAQIVKTGNLEKNGKAIPVVDKVHAGENGLLRGFEYTVATHGADAANSDRKEKIANKVHNGLVPVQNTAAFQNLSTNTSHDGNVKFDLLKSAAKSAVTWEYVATMDTGGTIASDGSSSEGGWQLLNNSNRQPITNDNQLKACLRAAFIAKFGTDAVEAQIDNLLNNNAFFNVIKQTNPGEGDIYKNTQGGQEAYSKEVLSGKQSEKTDLSSPGGTDAVANAKALLKGMVDSLKDSEDEKVTIGIAGLHAERALPKHPSLDALKVNGNDVATNVEDAFTKSENLVATPIDEDKAKHLFDKSVDTFLKEWLGNNDGVFNPQGQPPTGALNPGQLKQFIYDQFKDQAASRFVDQNRARKDLEAKIEAFLTKELMPQFVIADTNWGDGKSKKFHVIVPDLATGKPKLYKKDETTGELVPADTATALPNKKYINAKWEATTLKST